MLSISGFSSKCFCILKGRKVTFLQGITIGHPHIWILSMHIVSLLSRSRLVVCTFCAPFQICTSQENKHSENITRTISWNPPFLFSCKVTGIYVKICFQTRKVYVKPSTPIGDLLQWSSRNKFAPKFPLGVCGGDRLSRFTLDHTGFSLYCNSKSNVMKEAYLGAYQGVSTPHICLYWYTTALIFRPEQVH